MAPALRMNSGGAPLRVTAPPAPSDQPDLSRRPRWSLGGPHARPNYASRFVRPLAHLLVLSVVLATLPVSSAPVDRSTAWVEDVGSVQLEATWYDAPAPPVDWDAAPVPSSEAQPAPASDQSPQPASEARPPA